MRARRTARRIWPRVLVAVLAALTGPARAAEDCPAAAQAALAHARRLVLVTARTMDGPEARLRLYARDGPAAAWRALTAAEPAVVGARGLAWGYPFRTLAPDGEPSKAEGDRRTPAGFYRVGRSFGVAASPRPGHLVLRPGRAICVDDPASPAYNTIVVTAGAPAPAGEDMGAEPLYRRGLVVDYPSDAATRAGSCIFLHVWRGPARGTAGCVALPEARVAALQDFAAGESAIAILPEPALRRLAGCLPGVGPDR